MILGSDSYDFYAGEYFHLRSRSGMLLSRVLGYTDKRREEFQYGDLRDIKRLQPKCILALGDAALYDATGLSGRKQTVDDVRGYVLRTWGSAGVEAGIPVVCSYSPGSLLGRTKLWGVLAYDILRACEVAKTGAPSPEHLNYCVAPTEQEALALLGWCKEHPTSIISCDIENPSSAKGNDESELRYDLSTILQIQFTIAPYTGYAFPWKEPFISIAKEILALPNPKVGHNWWEFDLTHLEAHGCKVNGAQHDTMWMFHVIQPDLPKSLQYVASFFEPQTSPWKHTISHDLRSYGCKDSDIVYRIYHKLLQELQARRVGRAYHAHTFRVQWEVLDAMKRRGIYVNREAQGELKAKLDAEIIKVNRELQALVPEEVLNCQPKGGYKKQPKSITNFLRERVSVLCSGTDEVIGDDPQRLLEWFTGSQSVNEITAATGYSVRSFDGVERWYKLKPFLASSSKQVMCYIKHRGHKMPTLIGDDSKDSTGKKGLQQLYKQTGDEVYRLVLELRALSKLTDYIVDVGEDSCIHSTIRAYGTSSGQMSSHSPNVQNWPKGREIDKAIRNTIQAYPGHKLISIDLKGFHAVILGFLAGDAKYIRAAEHDIHSFVTAAVLRNKLQSVKKFIDPIDFPGVKQDELDDMIRSEGELRERLQNYDRWLELSDGDLGEMLAWMKKHYKYTRDKKIKNGVHGIQFGLQAKKLYQTYIENFKNQKEAQQILDIVKTTFPKVFQYQNAMVEKAHKEIWLYNPFGYRRGFYEAKKLTSQGIWINGEDAEEIKAYMPSSTAHGYFKEALLRCAEKGWMESYKLSNLIHDECVFNCPDSLVDECIENVQREIEKPSPYLIHPTIAPLGFSVGTDAEVGERWGDMRKYERMEVTV